MGKQEEQNTGGFADVFGLSGDSFTSFENEESKVEEVEEVVTEVQTEDGAEKITQDPVGVPSSTPNSDAGDDSEQENGAEKQAETEETPSEEGKEDASADAQKSETKSENVSAYEDVVNELINDELLDFDDEKEYDLESTEGLKELISETVEKKSAAAIDQYKQSLGEDAARMLQVLEQGGTVNDFVSMDQQVDFSKVDIDNEQNQAYLVEDWLKTQGYEDEEIQETIKGYYDAGMLKKQAEISQRKLSSHQESQNQALLSQKQKEQEENARLAQEQAEAFKEEVIKTRDIAGFSVSETKAKKLYDYITKADKDGKTEFEKNDTPENRLLYAYFAMEGFDKEKLSKDIANKQARSLKKKLSRYTDGNVKPKRGAQQVRRTDQDAPDLSMWSL